MTCCLFVGVVLLCHDYEAHPDESDNAASGSGRSILRLPRTPSVADNQVDSTGSSNQHCEVTSTVGPYPPSEEPSSTWTKDGWPRFFTEPINAWCYTNPWGGTGTGVVVDPIKTYHMGVALATRQTPFALLKPDQGAPVLVKVVDTKLPGGKQMLVPATAEDLRDGGKIVMKTDGSPEVQSAVVASGVGEGALQIKVPVVATVVPRILPGGRLRLCVEEPHHAYHTALSAEAPCISSSCTLPPPAPSPPLDLIPMDLFEPMECLPMGPQITAVDNVHQPPGSDDSDIYIGSFEESIPLSDSE